MKEPGLSQAERIAAAACRVSGVVGLDGGRYGEVATHSPGKRVIGVRLHDTGGEIHIVVDTRRPALAVGNHVRQLVEQLTRMPWTVVISDIVESGAAV